MSSPTHLLYLHGFRSSPQSAKAMATAARLAQINARRAARGLEQVHWICPQLPPSPRAAIALALERVGSARGAELAIIGSSLGGFYATWLARQRDCRAALLNPAVDPARDLARQLGAQTCWHDPGQGFTFTREHVDELHALQLDRLDQALPDAERFLLVAARNDEVLDCDEMLARYQGAALRVSPQGSHALTDFASAHLDAVLDWLGITESSH